MVDSFEKLLSDAGRSPHWRAIPEAIAQFRQGGGETTGMAFWRGVAQATGRPELSVRQMCRAYETVMQFSDFLGRERTEAALQLPYTWLEVVSRLAAIDPHRAASLLESPGYAPVVREVRKELEKARLESAESTTGLLAGQKKRRDAVGFVAQELAQALASAAPEISFVRWAADTPAVSPSLVAISRGSQPLAAALIAVKSDRPTIYAALGQAGWEATFFPSYWLALPYGCDTQLESVAATFAINNLGIARFDAGKSKFSVTLKPSADTPSPDRRSLITIPDRHRR